jgi:hypothetical protein
MVVPEETSKEQKVKDEQDKRTEMLFKLSETCWTEFETRRTYEWKVSFGLWAGLGIIAGFALKEDITLAIPIWGIVLFLFLILLAYLWWHIGLRWSNKRDQDKRHEYYRIIHKNLGFYETGADVKIDLFVTPEAKTIWQKLRRIWAHGAQLLITVSFLVFLAFILSNRDSWRPEKKNCHCNKQIECRR